MEKTDKEKLANERVENSRKRIAKVLNILEIVAQEMKWSCESMEWNDDIVYQIEEASLKLAITEDDCHSGWTSRPNIPDSSKLFD